MPRNRDYKTEYARRIERGAERGLSRSQARGHPSAVKQEPKVSQIKSESKRLNVPFESVARSKKVRIKDTNFIEKTSGRAWNQDEIRAFIDNARDQGKELVRAIYKKPGAKKGHTSSWYNIRTDTGASFAAGAIAAGLESYEDDDALTPEYDGDDLFALAFV